MQQTQNLAPPEFMEALAKTIQFFVEDKEGYIFQCWLQKSGEGIRILTTENPWQFFALIFANKHRLAHDEKQTIHRSQFLVSGTLLFQ